MARALAGASLLSSLALLSGWGVISREPGSLAEGSVVGDLNLLS